MAVLCLDRFALTAARCPRLVRSFCTALKPPASPTAAQLPGGHAASGRSRPPPRHSNDSASPIPTESLSVVLQAAGDEGEGVDVPKPASDRCGCR